MSVVLTIILMYQTAYGSSYSVSTIKMENESVCQDIGKHILQEMKDVKGASYFCVKEDNQ